MVQPIHFPHTHTCTHTLTAKFGSPAVIDALRTLLTDEDPNVRAVAAISLGRTGSTDERIVDELINLLSDKDRIVRQSACLSLGSMKAEKAIPHIGHVWYAIWILIYMYNFQYSG